MLLTILGRQVKTLEGLEISRATEEQLQACSELLIMYKLYTHFSDVFSDLHKNFGFLLFFGCRCAFGAFGCAMWLCVQLVNLVHLVSDVASG